MMASVTAFASRDALMAAVAERLADALRTAIADRGAACAALSGGTTPEPAYRLLAARKLDWSKVTFALVDERFVPPDQDPSNEGLLRRALAPAFANGARLESMYADTPTAREAAERADARYALLRFDIALMGMGPDGHTASWFPGAAALDVALDLESKRTVVSVHAPQAYGTPERLSLTRAALARAGHILVLILGAEKRAYLDSALSMRAEDAPIAGLFALSDLTPEVMWAP